VTVLVTGATGFIGSHLVRILTAEGFSVRILARPHTDIGFLAPLEPEVAYGDLRDRDAVFRAVKGTKGVFHVAADYRLWVPNPAQMFETNVQGTHNVLEAALQCGIEKVVYTSTVGVLGIPQGGIPGDEETPLDVWALSGPYKRSKYLAQEKAVSFCAAGLPVVIVNPTAPVGPGDRKPTPTGKIIVDFLNRRMPAYVDTGLNLVHVEDVARAHIQAYIRGKAGEKYILGNENLTLRQILQLLGDIAHLPAPRVRLPHLPVLAAAYCCEGLSHWTNKEPRIPLHGVKMSRKRMFFNSKKAIEQLGMPQTPVKQALRDAVSWFRDHAYVYRYPGQG
jgi:dihydroflavonol-4-reductase